MLPAAMATSASQRSLIACFSERGLLVMPASLVYTKPNADLGKGFGAPITRA